MTGKNILIEFQQIISDFMQKGKSKFGRTSDMMEAFYCVTAISE
jgi:hypothetical protein